MATLKIEVKITATPPVPVEIVKNVLDILGWDGFVKEEKVSEDCTILTYEWSKL